MMTQTNQSYDKSKLAVKKVVVSLIGIVTLIFMLASCSTYTEPKQGIWHKLEPGENLELISRRYSVPISDIKRVNDIYDPDDLDPGIQLYIPIPVRIQVEPPQTKTVTKVKPKPKQRQSRTKFIWPSQGTISSGFGMRHGRMHEGVDITKDKGREIRAAGSGVVEFAGYQKGYGRTIIINHGRRFKTLYAHNQKLYVKKGMRVKAGTIISRMGSSGKSTGIHLHFEVQYNGKPQNPLRYLPVR